MMNEGLDRRGLLKMAAGAMLLGAPLAQAAKNPKPDKKAKRKDKKNAAAAAVAPVAAAKPALTFKNEDFYTGGKFDREKGIDAIVSLCIFHGYPVPENFRNDLWISDYGLGEFTKVGLAAILAIDDLEGQYLGQDLFLLPNQMLPEHYHLKTEKAPPKLEAWLVRYGLSYVYGEGDKSEPLHAAIPESQKPWVSVYHEVALKPGQVTKLNRREAHHWQFAGPEGAIITEYGSYHDNDGVRHACPKIVFP